MKKLIKLFFAVVALVAYSCTTDTTEDLGVGLGSGENQTVISLSLESTRTQLGDKAGDLYPLYWSEGDKIAVNGVESNAAVISSDNAALASFTVNGVVETPYCITYPAASVGQVLFASQQTHTSNTTFAPGVSVMYGYSESGLGVQLQHLTGVLKVGVVGSAKLTMAQISTVDRTPIAGTFGIDFTTGELTATTGVKETIEYSFGEGVELSSEPTYIHVAVPEGTYDELYVTLYDEDGGVMYATVKADDTKPLQAGKVREFSNTITYVATDKVFVIKDVATLTAFKAGVEDGSITSDAIFVNDVDLTETEWASINGDTYTGTVRGNGYAVKGLTAPLFNTTLASFKGLHLRDVKIAETVNPNVGALVRRSVATAEVKPTIEHCSATGTISVNTPNFVYDKAIHNIYESFAIGGIAGTTFGVDFVDCHNSIDITVIQVVNSSNTTNIYPWVGGVVGLVDAPKSGEEVIALGNIYRCENDGDINFSEASFKGETVPSKTASCVRAYVGGVVGGAASSNIDCTVQDIVNRGDVTISGVTGDGVRVSGTFGYLATKQGSNIYNYGKVSYVNGICYYLQIAGGVGNCVSGTYLENVHNYGEVYIGEDVTIVSMVCGGLIAYQGSSAVTLDDKHSAIINSSNNANITVLSSQVLNHTSTSSFYYRVGGFSGWTQHLFYNCVNNGDIVCRGNLYNGDTSNYSIAIGGLVGYKTVNHLDQCTNNGDLTIDVTLTKSESLAIDKARMNAGGICGYSHLPINYTVNNGDISLSGTYAGDIRMGGIAGHQNTTNAAYPISKNCVNNGTVTITDGTDVGNLLEIGGGYGYSSKLENCSNTGDVVVGRVSVGTTTFIGGLSSYASGVIDTASNTGDITVADGATFGSTLTLGGVIGHYTSYGSNYTNEGNITMGETVQSENNTYVGGVLGFADYQTTTIYVENVINRGAISSKHYNQKGSSYYGGIASYIKETSYKALSSKNWDNYGSISMTGKQGTSGVVVCGIAGYLGGDCQDLVNHESGTIYVAHPTTDGGKTYVGGIANTVKDTASDLVNNADITVEGKIGHTLYGSGMIISNNFYARTNLVNNGNYTINAEIKTNCYVGGMMYDCGATATWTNCHNYGNITAGEGTKVGAQIRLGGFFAKQDSEYAVIIKGCSNSGDVVSRGTSGAHTHLGGLIGSFKDGTISIVDGFKNTGNIICTGTSNYDAANQDDVAGKLSQAVALGGIYGCMWGTSAVVNEDTPAWTGDIINEGDVIYEGKAELNNVCVGGIYGAATVAQITLAEGANLINTGNVKLGGTYVSGGLSTIGGIAGYPATSINGAQVFCDVAATDTNNAGMIYGVARVADSIVASNCKIGGTMSTRDVEDDSIVAKVINSSNYYNYIYNGNSSWPTAGEYDGCVAISSKDEITYGTTAE